MSAIVFENVSKRFILHHEKTRAFQDLLVKTLRRRNSTDEEFWALRDVSFEVSEGQMVGLIGPNGAGKSTALKLLAHIIEPTRGKIRVQGRLNALIELGAGFHEELTGRENVYLSGALLGLSRREIQKHFDEIVAFSELEKFIDTQVKHYSSGMHVRLGFAIATCIESEILLVDEVLAVGDASFQRKCLERIAEIRAQGMTIFYVTHQLAEIERTCDRALLLADGNLVADDQPSAVIAQYEQLRKQHQPLHQAFFNVEYLDYQVPAEMYVNSHYQMTVTLQNQSPEIWRGRDYAGKGSVSLTYHWLDHWGNLHQLLAPGTILSHDLEPSQTLTLTSPVLPPAVPGQYRLEIDMLAEGRGWFSRQGCTGPQVQVQVLLPATM